MNPEPQKNLNSENATTPMWIVVLFAVLTYGGFLYLDRHSGDYSAQVYAPYHNEAQLASLQPSSGGPSPYVLGSQVYNRPTCVSCHQATLVGVPGQFPPLAGSEWVLEPEPGRIIRIVLNGLQGPIDVKGSGYNNVMVAWKDVLTDEEIAAVITYVRQNKDCGNNAPVVTPEQVKAIREKIKGRNQAFTADELKKLSPAE